MSETCPVCYCELGNDKNYVITPCSHKFCFFCIARILTQNSNATCPMCREILFQTTENMRRLEVERDSSRVNIEINFSENSDGIITPIVEINTDTNRDSRENAATLIQRFASTRLRSIHPDM